MTRLKATSLLPDLLLKLRRQLGHTGTHTLHTLGADSYNYSDGNWQVALCVAYRALLGGDADCSCFSA